MSEKLISNAGMNVMTRSDGNRMVITFAEPIDIDEDGGVVISRKQARDLRDNLTWQFEDAGQPDEDG